MDPSYFVSEALVGDIIQGDRTLPNGKTVLCYVSNTKSEPHEHSMGPWCPTNIADGADKGGVWFDGGKVHDMDGAFEGAARPDVDPRFENMCVEGRPEWFDIGITTYVIPVEPTYEDRPIRSRRGAVGVAFNGVNFDPPAPTDAILAAHTLAPLDDHGGHINPRARHGSHPKSPRTKLNT